MIACDSCEEWYHGDCMNISEKDAKLIIQYICIRCHEEGSTLQTRWKTKRDEGAGANTNTEERKSRKRKERGESKNDKKMKKCGDCMGCYRTEDCRRCEACTRKSKHKERCKLRICINFGGYVIFKSRNVLQISFSNYPGRLHLPVCSSYDFLFGKPAFCQVSSG